MQLSNPPDLPSNSVLPNQVPMASKPPPPFVKDYEADTDEYDSDATIHKVSTPPKLPHNESDYDIEPASKRSIDSGSRPPPTSNHCRNISRASINIWLSWEQYQLVPLLLQTGNLYPPPPSMASLQNSHCSHSRISLSHRHLPSWQHSQTYCRPQ